jgi:hypothetical protein
MTGLSRESPNALRYAGAPGHVESYFLRANDPQKARALWLKATVFAPLEGEPQVESWFIYFDAARSSPIAGRETASFRPDVATYAGGRDHIAACRLTLDLAARGSVRGSVHTPEGDGRVDLTWAPSTSRAAAPLSLLRPRALLKGPFPRSKLLTPFPSLRFSGRVVVGGEDVVVDGWTGMQGHNWGREHAFEYAWGQCLFPASSREPETMLEGFSARVRVGGRVTPRISCLVVRRGDATFRFDRLFDLWRQHADVGADRWAVRMAGPAGEARLTMDATERPMACLGYRNPDGHMSYCFNTKLARVELLVQPRHGAAFACESDHDGALEFLRDSPDPRFPDVV